MNTAVWSESDATRDTYPPNSGESKVDSFARGVRRLAGLAAAAGTALEQRAREIDDEENSFIVDKNGLPAARDAAAAPIRAVADLYGTLTSDAMGLGLTVELETAIDDARSTMMRRNPMLSALRLQAERVAAGIGERERESEAKDYQLAAMYLDRLADELEASFPEASANITGATFDARQWRLFVEAHESVDDDVARELAANIAMAAMGGEPIEQIIAEAVMLRGLGAAISEETRRRMAEAWRS